MDDNGFPSGQCQHVMNSNKGFFDEIGGQIVYLQNKKEKKEKKSSQGFATKSLTQQKAPCASFLCALLLYGA
jgi:hypothetical protein